MSSHTRALQSLSSNLPPTPGRQVKHLKSELEKKETENEALKSSIADLTKALESIQLVQDKAASADNPFHKGDVAIEGKKKKGKRKDENAPTPAMTAYRYYCEDLKAKLDDGEEQKSGEAMRRMWKECQGDARKKYVEMAAADKKRFEKENEVYQRHVSEKEEEEKALGMYYEKQKQALAMEFFEAHIQAQNVVNDDKKKKKKAKDPDAPKGAKSSYMFFCQEKREDFTKKNPGKSPAEVTKILGEEWNKLEKGKRGKNGTKKYDDKAAKDKIRYDEEKEVYDALKATHQQRINQEREMQLQQDKEEALKMMKELQKENATTQEPDASTDATKPSKKSTKPSGPKKPSSAYIFFVAQNRAKVKAGMPETATTQEIMAEVGRQWRSLDDENKKSYADLATKDKERYQKELEASK